MPILAPLVNNYYYADGSYTVPEPGTVYFYVAGGSGAGGASFTYTDQYGNPIGTFSGGSGRSGYYITIAPVVTAGTVINWYIGSGGITSGAGGTNSLGYSGGASGTSAFRRGGGGGAATVVRINGSNYIIAGGGGGGGGAGNGGGDTGQVASATRGAITGGAGGNAGGSAGGGGGGGAGPTSGNGGGAGGVAGTDQYGNPTSYSGGQTGGNGGNLVPSGGSLTQSINGVGADANGSSGFVRIVFIPSPNGKSPLPTSGAITLDDLQNQFGGSSPIGMNEYYKGGGIVLATDAAGSVPASGTISVENFRNAKRTQLNQEVFTSSQTWTSPAAVGSTMQVWVVGGGGGGGGFAGGGVNGGGGGGGGGVAYHGSFPLSPSTAYTITVGAGGTIRAAGNPSSLSGAGNTIYAYGGGYGGYNGANIGGAGGSGGGGAGNRGYGNYRYQFEGGGVIAASGAQNSYGNSGGSSYFFDGGDGTNFTPSGGGGGGGAVGGSWGYAAGGAGLSVPTLFGYAGVNGILAGGGGAGAYRSALTFTPVGGFPGGSGGGGAASFYVTYPGTANSGGGGGGVAGGQQFGSPGPSTGGSGVVIIRFWT